MTRVVTRLGKTAHKLRQLLGSSASIAAPHVPCLHFVCVTSCFASQCKGSPEASLTTFRPRPLGQ